MSTNDYPKMIYRDGYLCGEPGAWMIVDSAEAELAAAEQGFARFDGVHKGPAPAKRKPGRPSTKTSDTQPEAQQPGGLADANAIAASEQASFDAAAAQ